MGEDAVYECCICKGELRADDSQRLDPCALTISSNAGSEPRTRHAARYHCHAECFAKLVGDDVFWFVDADRSTHD